MAERKTWTDWLRHHWRKLIGADLPTPIYKEFKDFFGDDLERLEVHEKLFPGYDVASLFRGLQDFFATCTHQHKDIGSTGHLTVRSLLQTFKNVFARYTRPMQHTYTRVAVDVEEELSVVDRGLYLAEMKPGVGTHRTRRTAVLQRRTPPEIVELGAEKLAICLAVDQSGYWDGMSTNHVAVHQVMVSVACRSREVADRFFAELEARRQANNVFRGKVIDPSIHSGMIHAIGFRAIKEVREEDLILPEDVKTLIQRSVVGFSKNHEVLNRLGVDLKRGILLHGQPGTGKTSICLYLAGLLPQFTVCFVSGDRLLHPRAICQMARYLQPAMVVFEDIDLIAQQRDQNGLATVLGELMNQIDGCEPAEQVFFVMNTNSLDRLESAVRNRPGRVDQIIEIPLPDREARRQLLLSFARGVRLTETSLAKILDATQDMSPAMLKEIVKRAVVVAVERTDGEDVCIDESDLVTAANQVKAMREPLVPGSLGFRMSDG